MNEIRAWWAVSAALVIAAFAALAVIPQRSVASPPETGSGSYVVTGADVTDVRVGDDGTVFVTETEYVDATGTLVGSFAHDLVIAIHPDGSLTVHGTGTFTGTVDGVSGSFEDALEAQGSLVTFELHGSFTILSGSGGLKGLQGHATIDGIPATSGTYTIQFQM
jgi:hypothetical protein